MAVKDRIGVVRGTFLRPSVSKNRRLYTKENIGSAIRNMQNRMTQGLSLDMKSSHAKAGEDDALATVGKITRVWQDDDGSGMFEADIPNTSIGRDIAALVTPESPYIKHVSIRGNWMDEPVKVTAPDGAEAWTGDNLDIEGIDFTQRPGVAGAEIHSTTMAEARPANAFQILEEVSEAVFVEEVDEAGNAPGNGALPYGKVQYADNGYQSDKQKRYPIDSAAHVRAAWSYVNQAKNAGKYTANQLATIKKKIKAAAGKFGIDISSESESLILACAEVIERHGDEATIEDVDRLLELMALEGTYGPPPDDDRMESTPTAEDLIISDPDGAELPGGGPMFCSNAHLVPAQAMYCPTCGEPLSQAESEESETEGDAQVADTESNAENVTFTKEELEAIFASEDAHAAYAAAVASKTASAGPKNATGHAAGHKSNAPTGTGKESDETTTATTETTDNSQEAATMTTETTPVAPGFTSEAVQEIYKVALEKAAKKAAEAAVAAQAPAAAVAETSTTAVTTTEDAPAKPITEADLKSLIEETTKAAYETARKEAVEEYRRSGTGARKGFQSSRMLTADGNIIESDGSNLKTMTGEDMAKMSTSEFRSFAAEALSYGTGTEFFGGAPRLAEGFSKFVQ